MKNFKPDWIFRPIVAPSRTILVLYNKNKEVKD